MGAGTKTEGPGKPLEQSDHSAANPFEGLIFHQSAKGVSPQKPAVKGDPLAKQLKGASIDPAVKTLLSANEKKINDLSAKEEMSISYPSNKDSQRKLLLAKSAYGTIFYRTSSETTWTMLSSGVKFTRNAGDPGKFDLAPATTAASTTKTSTSPPAAAPDTGPSVPPMDKSLKDSDIGAALAKRLEKISENEYSQLMSGGKLEVFVNQNLNLEVRGVKIGNPPKDTILFQTKNGNSLIWTNYSQTTEKFVHNSTGGYEPVTVTTLEKVGLVYQPTSSMPSEVYHKSSDGKPVAKAHDGSYVDVTVKPSNQYGLLYRFGSGADGIYFSAKQPNTRYYVKGEEVSPADRILLVKQQKEVDGEASLTQQGVKILTGDRVSLPAGARPGELSFYLYRDPAGGPKSYIVVPYAGSRVDQRKPEANTPEGAVGAVKIDLAKEKNDFYIAFPKTEGGLKIYKITVHSQAGGTTEQLIVVVEVGATGKTAGAIGLFGKATGKKEVGKATTKPFTLFDPNREE